MSEASEEFDYLPNITRKLKVLCKDYGFTFGEIVAILGKSIEFDVFYMSDEDIIAELDKMIEKKKQAKGKK